jgi:hypothetical protein
VTDDYYAPIRVKPLVGKTLAVCESQHEFKEWLGNKGRDVPRAVGYFQGKGGSCGTFLARSPKRIAELQTFIDSKKPSLALAKQNEELLELQVLLELVLEVRLAAHKREVLLTQKRLSTGEYLYVATRTGR